MIKIFLFIFLGITIENCILYENYLINLELNNLKESLRLLNKSEREILRLSIFRPLKQIKFQFECNIQERRLLLVSNYKKCKNSKNLVTFSCDSNPLNFYLGGSLDCSLPQSPNLIKDASLSCIDSLNLALQTDPHNIFEVNRNERIRRINRLLLASVIKPFFNFNHVIKRTNTIEFISDIDMYNNRDVIIYSNNGLTLHLNIKAKDILEVTDFLDSIEILDCPLVKKENFDKTIYASHVPTLPNYTPIF